MDSYLPFTTKPEDITALLGILAPKIKGANLAELKTISKSVDDNLLNSCMYLFLVKYQSDNYILSEEGRNLTQTNEETKLREILRTIIKKIPTYDLTLEYLHHNGKFSPTKNEIGSYWNEYFNSLVKDYDDDTLTSAVIFFLRLLEWAGLGKYIFAGRGRETRIDFDQVELAKYVTFVPNNNNATEKTLSSVPSSQEATKKESDTKPIETPVTLQEMPSEDDDYISSLRALKKLKIELTWKDLDSDGAKKLIIDKLDELKSENTVLNAKVEKYQKLEKTVAVLDSKVKGLSKQDFYKTSVNSFGGVVLGASISFDDVTTRIVGIAIGLGLIAISYFITEKYDKTVVE